VTVTRYSVKPALLICLKTDVRFFALGACALGGFVSIYFLLTYPPLSPGTGWAAFLCQPRRHLNQSACSSSMSTLWCAAVHNEVGAGGLFLTADGCNGRIRALIKESYPKRGRGPERAPVNSGGTCIRSTSGPGGYGDGCGSRLLTNSQSLLHARRSNALFSSFLMSRRRRDPA